MQTTAGSLALVGADPAAGRVHRPAPARRGRRDPRQDEPVRVGELPLHALARAAGAAAAASAATRTRSTATRPARARARAPRRRRTCCAVAVGTETDGSIVSPSTNCGARRHQADGRPREPRAASSRSRTARTPRARWRAPSPTPRSCWRRWPASIPRDPGDARAAGQGADRLHELPRPQGPGGRAHRRRRARSSSARAPRPTRWPRRRSPTCGSAGAVIVDPADIATVGETDDAEFEVLLYEFKADLNAYLASLGAGDAGPDARRPHRLQREATATSEMPYFGQEIFVKAEAKGPLTDKAYLDALAKDLRAVARGGHRRGDGRAQARRARGADRRPGVADRPRQRRLRSPAAARRPPASPATRTSPCRRASSSACRWACRSSAAAWSEPTLIRLAYAFEQATKARKAPRFLTTADLGLGKP